MKKFLIALLLTIGTLPVFAANDLQLQAEKINNAQFEQLI